MNLLVIRRIEYAILGLFSLCFIYYAFQALIIGDTFRFIYVLIPSLALSLLPVVFEYAMKVRFPPGFKSLFSLALLVHVAGGISRFYWKFAPFYDKIAHVCSALALFLLIISVFAVLDYEGTTIRWQTVLVSTIVLVTILMIAWEISEYVIDMIATTSYNNGIVDSIGDVIANIIGIIIGFFIIRYYRTLIPAGKTMGYILTL
ncbi:MAG: hypothetical protein BWY93_00167 [Euryarchaeota archaeon ADurb.BinA087]|nr:MAG: hypothetical protein BWY93_00167 [Euryarchaeota archaeon ADurb.BinA087]